MGVGTEFSFFLPVGHIIKDIEKKEKRKSHLWSALLKLPSRKLTVPGCLIGQFFKIFPGRYELLKVFFALFSFGNGITSHNFWCMHMFFKI